MAFDQDMLKSLLNLTEGSNFLDFKSLSHEVGERSKPSQ